MEWKWAPRWKKKILHFLTYLQLLSILWIHRFFFLFLLRDWGPPWTLISMSRIFLWNLFKRSNLMIQLFEFVPIGTTMTKWFPSFKKLSFKTWFNRKISKLLIKLKNRGGKRANSQNNKVVVSNTEHHGKLFRIQTV